MKRILIGGSPCTFWSIAQTKNRETEASGMGWELFKNYLIALEKYKPDYFLYENNKSMSAAIRAQITEELGMEPILINSALVSAQSRQRLYWVGKRNPDGTYSRVEMELPEDRGILLRDILESGIPMREKGYTLKANYANAGPVNGVCGRHFPAPMAVDEKAQCLRASYFKDGIRNMVGNTVDRKTCVAQPVRVGTIESGTQTEHDSKPFRVYSPDGKAVTLQGEAGGYGAKTGLYATPICINQLSSGKSRTVDAHMGKLENNLVPRLNDPNPAKQQYDCIIQPVRVGDMPNAKGEVSGSQSGRIYSADGKSVPLQARPNGGGADGASTGLYAILLTDCTACAAGRVVGRRINADGHRDDYNQNIERFQRFEVNIDPQKPNCLSTIEKDNMVAIPIQIKELETENRKIEEMAIEMPDGKLKPIYAVLDGQITIKGKTYPIKLPDGFYIIRKLTVLECMRLQTVPEGYIFPVSESQAYKMLGNGWTVDVIAHIMSHFEGITTEPVEILSMYDGMSCGHIALDKLGATVVRYYATEIDKYAIKTTMANYPDTIQLGDAFQLREDDWSLPQVQEG